MFADFQDIIQLPFKAVIKFAPDRLFDTRIPPLRKAHPPEVLQVPVADDLAHLGPEPQAGLFDVADGGEDKGEEGHPVRVGGVRVQVVKVVTVAQLL